MDKTGKLHLVDQGVDNMTNLVELSDHSLLTNLEIRYAQKLIYTYIGSILISINPYKELGIYEEKQIQSYQNKSIQDMPPHLFGIAEINFNKMMMENENQVIVISGESGAGKTESFKRLLKYFAHVSGGIKDLKQNINVSSNDIATKILDSTPLLESFGNAQTIRNDNSSRFGKYVEIFFENGNICGSKITNYLLEKSRIVNISSKERGYHIFYEVLRGLDSYNKSIYCFKQIESYSYLNKSKNFNVKDRDDAKNLADFMKEWTSLGISSEDLDVTMRILSAVLHLGNVNFLEEQEASYLVELENIGVVAKMLEVDFDSLKHCLTTKTTETIRESSISPLNKEQSVNYRDTLAKHLYSELFNWIVTKVNGCLNQSASQPQRRFSVFERNMVNKSTNLKCIAMLDIYGFENFPENSLEQLCINYANETLQQFFNRYVFELEQEEYKQEGISWHYITYPDNQPIIDLLSAKPNGIIQILNDECSIPQGSDELFLNKCHNVHLKNANYEKPKKVYPPQFIIHHFAGKISYIVVGFLEKNRDVLKKEIINVIENCKVKEISTMFRNKREQQTKNPTAKARTPAVMGDFQNSLNTLLSKMKTCQPWFIRCLKPNNEKAAMQFNKEIVMDQMKYTGILETVKIRKSGFPIRILFTVFLSRFYLILTKEIRKGSKRDPREACKQLMLKFKGQQGKHFEIGKTKLFLKETFANYLESQVRIIRNRSAIIIQRKWRAYWQIKLVIIQNQAATKLQAAVRGFLDRRRLRRLRIGILKLQSYVRMQIARKKFLQDNPQFLKYILNKPRQENEVPDNSKLVAYKVPQVESSKKPKKHNKRKVNNQFNFDLLKIPMELAYLFEKATENQTDGYGIPGPECIIQTGRAQHIWNREEYKLPENINEFLLANLLDEYGTSLTFEAKSRPITMPYIHSDSNSDHKDDCLTAHKLILRILHAKSMPLSHRYLATSYLSFMTTKSLELQKEIFIQIIAETLPNKSSRNIFQSESEDDRLIHAWNLLGNILSFISPSNEIYNYILKYVSDCFGVDQAVTCQEKLLHFVAAGLPQICRIFPVSNLEYRANQKGTKTCLNVIHPDGVSNSVHLNSFTIAEDLASHSLCFRIKRYKLMKGWSISIIYPDKIFDCGGQNYVFDVISGLELPQKWSEITGRSIEKSFLVSRRHAIQTDVTDFPSRGFLKNVSKPSKPPSKTNNNPSTFNSLHSMDSWVEKEFDSSFRFEDTASIPIHEFIHGLEDELNNTNQGQPQMVGEHFKQGARVSQNFGNSLNSNTPLQYEYVFQPKRPTTMYFPAVSNDFDMQQDPIFLQEQLNTVQLENKVIQSSIEREILQNRLQRIQNQRHLKSTNFVPNLPVQYSHPYPTMPAYEPQQMMNPYPFYQHYNPPSFSYQFGNRQSFPNQNLVMNGNETYEHLQNLSNNQNNQTHLRNQSTMNSEHNQHIITNGNNMNNLNQGSSEQFMNTEIQNGIVPSIPNKIPIPPAPPVPTNMSSHIQNLAAQNSENEQNVLARKKSILKYSDVGNPSELIVDDTSVLPVLAEEEMKKSYRRAAEVPKVDVSNRANFLENFFKNQPLVAGDTVKMTKKRQAPTIPVDDNKYPEEQLNAINLMATMNSRAKLIPRPTMSESKPNDLVYSKRKSLKFQSEISTNNTEEIVKDDHQLQRMNINGNQGNPIKLLEREISLPRLNMINETVSKPIPKPRKYTSSKKAIILSGLPDMRYFTYQKTPWFLLLKREIYLPNEIQNTTMLNPMIFCQIIRDLIEFPCKRWLQNEKQTLFSILKSTNITKDINTILRVPANIMLQVINEAQNCELYFSRFYSIQWPNVTKMDGMIHWLAISHTGIRFVEQNFRMPDSDLHIVLHISFSSIAKIDCKELNEYNNPQVLIIKTKLRKKFVLRTEHASSAKNLILEFLDQPELEKSHGTLNLGPTNDIYSNKVKRKRQLLTETQPFTDSQTMTLGVNNQRIPLKSVVTAEVPKVENKTYYQTKRSPENLIDFVANVSRYKDRKYVTNVILRWQQEQITEPILPFLNNALFLQALDIHRSLLLLSKDFAYEHNDDNILYAVNSFKNLLQNIELKDEFILQIFKQINGNTSTEGRNYLWNFLSIIIMFVGPTERMRPYLVEHLNQIIKNILNEDQHLAVYTLKNLNIFAKYGPRKEMPSDEEFNNLMRGIRESNISIFIPNESVTFSIPYFSSVEDVLSLVCKSIDVMSKMEMVDYSLAMVEINKTNVPIRVVEYLKTDLYFFDTLYSLMQGRPINLILYLFRMSWITPLNLEYRTPNFISFTFNQVSKIISKGDWLPNSNNESDISNISKIAYLNFRGQGLEKPKVDDLLKTMLSNKMIEHKKKTIYKKHLIKMINSEISSIMNNQLDSQKMFLELVENFPQYGDINYPILQIKDLSISGPLFIHFTTNSILLSKDFKDVILNISIPDLVTFKTSFESSKKAHFTITYENDKEIQFSSIHVPEVIFMLRQYLAIKATQQSMKA